MLLQGVAVLVQRNGGIGVAQDSGQCDDVHTVLQSPGGESVPQGVEIRVLYSRPPHAPLEQVLVGPGLIGRPILLAEDIALGIVAGILLHQGKLDLPVLAQLLIELITEVDDPPGVICFCGRDGADAGGGLDGSIVVWKAVSGLTDQELSLFHVDVIPAQTAHLTHPQTGKKGENHAKGSRFRHGPTGQDQTPLLLLAQHTHLFFLFSGKTDAFQQVGIDEPIPLGLLEGQMQHIAQVSQGLYRQAASTCGLPTAVLLIEELL